MHGAANPPLDAASSTAARLNRLLTIHPANSAHLRGVMPGRRTGRLAMSINDLPVLSALRTKMQWHQERQRVLAEHASTPDTRNSNPRDLVAPKFDATAAAAGATGSLAMMRTAASHIAPP